MAFENLVTQNPRFDATLDQGHQLLTQLTAAGKSGVLFAQPVPGSTTGTLLIPELATQDNGSAPWVDTSQDLETNGVTQSDGSQQIVPTNIPLYLQVWIETMQNYYVVAQVLAQLARGETIAEALE